jgi:hypothetical protein
MHLGLMFICLRQIVNDFIEALNISNTVKTIVIVERESNTHLLILLKHLFPP